MKSFTYTVKDELGIHARPAGQIVTEVKKFSSTVTIEAEGKKANASKLIAIMTMGVKCGQTVTVTADGADEEEAISCMKQFFEANL